jgi:hypothetical protein
LDASVNDHLFELFDDRPSPSKGLKKLGKYMAEHPPQAQTGRAAVERVVQGICDVTANYISGEPIPYNLEKRRATDAILSLLDEAYQRGAIDIAIPTATKRLLAEKELEARIDENQRWANGYAQAVVDHPGMDDPATMFAAKADFEARIKELYALSKGADHG